jgi:hypothetical protein
MIAGLGTILCVLRFSSIAFTWYVMIGSLTTFFVGAVASRLIKDSANNPSERTNGATTAEVH